MIRLSCLSLVKNKKTKKILLFLFLVRKSLLIAAFLISSIAGKHIHATGMFTPLIFAASYLLAEKIVGEEAHNHKCSPYSEQIKNYIERYKCSNLTSK